MRASKEEAVPPQDSIRQKGVFPISNEETRITPQETAAEPDAKELPDELLEDAAGGYRSTRRLMRCPVCGKDVCEHLRHGVKNP